MSISHRVIFFGTPSIASKCLQALIDKKINVVAVVTKPDAFVGRKHVLTQSEVKILALKNNITILQPKKLSEIVNQIKILNPNLIITCAYGKIIPQSILDIPKYHCVNIHTSLLPRWRGGAPIHHAILAGDEQTGISIMYMDKGLDTGNIIFQKTCQIDSNETYRSLYNKLELLSYDMLVANIDNLFNDDLPSIKQDENKATFAPVISSEDEKINWNESVSRIDCKIRGLYDVPIACAIYENQHIKILSAEKINDMHTKPGEIIRIDKNGILVSASDGSILLKKIQLPSKKPSLVKDLINGKHLFKLNSFFI